MKLFNWKIAVALLGTGATLPILMLGRGYPWTFALIVATAVGLLLYTTASTVERLRGLLRK